jgi:hypothetical protein
MLDPARATEAKVRAASKRPDPAGDLAPPIPPGARWAMLAGGLAAVLGTAFGMLVAPVFHAVSAAGGVALVGMSLSGTRRGARAKGDGPGLYYHGPVRKPPGR